MSIAETFAKTRNNIGSKIIKKLVDIVWGNDDVFFDDDKTPRDPYANLSLVYKNGFITKIIGISTRSAAEELRFKLDYYRGKGPVDALDIYAHSNRTDLYEAEVTRIVNARNPECKWYMDDPSKYHHTVSPSYSGYRGGTIKFTKDSNYSIVFEED